MSIKHWLSDDGRKAIERMGWPEWEDPASDGRCWLCLPGFAGGKDVFCIPWSDGPEKPSPTIDDLVTQHEAMCLLRDHARVWLLERGDDITLLQDDTGGIEHIVVQTHQLAEGETTEPFVSDPDYDAALIAAVLAVGEQE